MIYSLLLILNMIYSLLLILKPFCRAVDFHSFSADPDPSCFFFFDPDPVVFFLTKLRCDFKLCKNYLSASIFN